MDQAVLRIENLNKSFGKVHAVRDLSFSIAAGSCFGLLGPNGAGKSTTIEIIEQIMKPDSGGIYFRGKPIDSRFFQHFGVQFQQTALPASLTVRETLECFAGFYSTSQPIDQMIDLCQLGEFQHRRHELISGGQRQRLFLGLALLHDPEVILLDEPTTGLDPQARRHLWEIVTAIKESGKTLLLTTHYMDEAYELCDEIGILDHGQIIAQGSPDDLLMEHCQSVVIRLKVQGQGARFKELFPAAEIDAQGGATLLSEDTNSTLRQLVAADWDLSQISIRPSNLEDLFLKLTGKGLRS